MMRRSLLLGALAMFASMGCSSAGTDSGFGDGDDGGGGGGSGGDGGGGGTNPGIDGGLNLGDSSGGDGASGCSAASELVYVFATDSSIWSFNPPTKQFVQIATADCQTSMQPNSMAIDRNLVAWLNYFSDSDDGALFKFDLNTRTGCTQAVSLSNGFGQVGMGFSTDVSGGTAETLYVDGIAGAGLGKLTGTTITPIGDFSSDSNLAGQSAELTGTGDARLFGYFTTSPYVRVAQIDKTNANIISDNVLNGFTPPADWAFSFWGGDFYLYTSDGLSNSKVVHYAPSTNQLDLDYVDDAGIVIVGAGVSTCAPVRPPS